MILRSRAIRGATIIQSLLLTIGAGVAASCSGNVAGGGGPGGNGAGNGNGNGTGSGGAGMTPDGVFAPAPGGLRRLTVPQYRNSIADLLGAGALPSTQLEADSALSGFASVGAARLSLSAPITEEFETSALEIARTVLGPSAASRATFAGCMPAGATDDACATAWLKRFGRRAWRRPLTDAEVGAYSALIKSVQTTSKDFFIGLQYALAALLESPNFLYRVELGAPDTAKPAQRRFDDYELATRLSFFIWNTTPDDALLDAADAHQLTGGQGSGSAWQTQVKRLLASDRAGLAARTFFTEYFRLADLDTLQQLPTVFPQKTDTLGAAMREETARFMADVAFARNADFRTLFDSRDTFVNAELARLYGLPPVSGADFVKTTLPDSGLRAGYLGQASFLAGNAHSNSTSPTNRGKFIQEMLRCVTIPPPPNAVPPLPDDASVAGKTMRQKLEMHRSVEPCKSCHTVMDPLGLAFENFDGIGAFRTMEVGQPIDASGDVDGKHFTGPRGLEAILRDDPDVGACAARNLYRYAMGHIEGIDGNEEPALATIINAFQVSQYHFSDLMQAIVASPAFFAAAAPSEMDPAGGGSGGSSGGGSGGSSGGSNPDAGAQPPPIPIPANPTYARDIAPILAAKCEPCHTTQAKAGLNFSYANLVTDGAVTNGTTVNCDVVATPGRRVVPGLPDQSLLWAKTQVQDELLTTHKCGNHMPPVGMSTHVLATAEADTIRLWIKQGAKP